MRRLVNLVAFRRRRMERGLERELRYHVERRVDELRRSGAGELDARRQAAIEFGGVTQVEEEVRDAWFFGWLDDRRRDMKHAMRSLVRSPGFTITAVLSLALGIGANAAIFSLFDQVVFRRLPVREPERLVLVDWIGSKAGSNWGSGNLMSYPLCRELQDNDRFFEGVFCRHPTVSYVSSDGRPEVLPIEIVSGSYFEVLGVRPEVGRLIARSDDVAPEAQPVVVVSYQYGKSHLGGAPDVAGRKLMINRNPMTIIGVAPESFRGVDPGERPVLWVPAMMNRQANLETIPLESRRAQWMHIFGRLKPGFSAEQVKRGLQPWFRSMLEADLRGPDFP